MSTSKTLVTLDVATGRVVMTSDREMLSRYQGMLWDLRQRDEVKTLMREAADAHLDGVASMEITREVYHRLWDNNIIDFLPIDASPHKWPHLIGIPLTVKGTKRFGAIPG